MYYIAFHNLCIKVTLECARIFFYKVLCQNRRPELKDEAIMQMIFG